MSSSPESVAATNSARGAGQPPGHEPGIDSVPAEQVREHAHAFNNVLGTLIGYADLAMTLNDNARLHGYLEEILRAARRGRNLVATLQQELAARQPGMRPPADPTP
jgi:hypothetical protein